MAITLITIKLSNLTTNVMNEIFKLRVLDGQIQQIFAIRCFSHLRVINEFLEAFGSNERL